MEDPISPIDGRYVKKTQELKKYFNEAAFFKNRLLVEMKYFLKLIDILPELSDLRSKKSKVEEQLHKVYIDFNDNSYQEIKNIEDKTKHDVKAIEYYMYNIFRDIGIESYIPFIHFGLTSQDINTTANILAFKSSIFEYIIPCLEDMHHELMIISEEMKGSVMLSFTHGQPAVPTTTGKEFSVFLYRLETQVKNLEKSKFTTKFGGAVGNFNAHYLAYPNIDCEDFGDKFIKEEFNLTREKRTTQISNYDN